MRIKMAKSSGFCMGVRRAVELALESVHHREGPIYSYGPLIHNPQAVDLLKAKGLTTIEASADSLSGIDSGTVIIRAHGVPPQERDFIKSRGLDIIDATCPRVIRVQQIIKKHTGKGALAVIWGNPQHPEVIGLVGHAVDGRARVIQKPEEVENLPLADQVILVAQTTQNIHKYDEISRAVTGRWPEALVFETICGATQRRQDDVKILAGEVQAMVIVGGHTSGNTIRLASVAETQGVKTIHIETEEELNPEWFRGVESVGVTAGASTPNWMIKRVIRWLERYNRSYMSIGVMAHRLLRMLVLSNIYVAFGAGCLCLAAALLQGIDPQARFFGITFFYVHAMHVLNLFLDKEASKFNDPDRSIFLEKHKTVLVASGVFSAVVSLGLSLTAGTMVFIFLIFMSTLGLLYALPLVPDGLTRYTKFKRLKDIPTSKTLSLSGGWAFCLTLVPALDPAGNLNQSAVMTVPVIFLMVFIRSAMADIMEIQGDRIVGRETIPIIFGVKNTLKILMILTLVLVLFLAGGYLTGIFNSLALWLIICAGYAAWYQWMFRREGIISSVFFEAVLDGGFILAGLLAWFWFVL